MPCCALLVRKTPPKGSATLIATALASDARPPPMAAAATWPTSSPRPATPAPRSSPSPSFLAGYEGAPHPGSWRSVSTSTRRYLLFLADCGYTLADVERRACGEPALSDAHATDLDVTGNPGGDTKHDEATA